MDRVISNELKINILRKCYPNIYDAIEEKIETLFVEHRVNDISRVSEIIKEFCAYKAINFLTVHGACTARHEINMRSQLIAVLLMFYQPEKLQGYSIANTRQYLGTKIAERLGSSTNTISTLITQAVFEYKAYKGFKTAVDTAFFEINKKIK